jgi:ADP-ribosylglycohydrolase
MKPTLDQIRGAIFGSAIGDAMGSAFENLDGYAVAMIEAGGPTVYYPGQPGSLMWFHKPGDVSDDTYMSIGVLQGLFVSSSPLNVEAVEKAFQRWFVGPRFSKSAPGIATTKGLSRRSPVPSEGNGTVMKAHVSGIMFDDPKMASNHAQAVGRITHKSEIEDHNEAAAALVVYAQRYALTEKDLSYDGLQAFIEKHQTMKDWALQELFDKSKAITDEQIAKKVHISGWSWDTAAWSVRILMKEPNDLIAALRLAIVCGGDTDTTAAVVGGIVGARVGYDSIPAPFIKGLMVADELHREIDACLKRKNTRIKKA